MRYQPLFNMLLLYWNFVKISRTLPLRPQLFLQTFQTIRRYRNKFNFWRRNTTWFIRQDENRRYEISPNRPLCNRWPGGLWVVNGVGRGVTVKRLSQWTNFVANGKLIKGAWVGRLGWPISMNNKKNPIGGLHLELAAIYPTLYNCEVFSNIRNGYD